VRSLILDARGHPAALALGGKVLLGTGVGMATEVGIQMVFEGKSIDEVDRSDVVVAGGVGAVFPGAVSAVFRGIRAWSRVSKNVEAIRNLGSQSANTGNRAAKLEQGIDRNVEQAINEIQDAMAVAGAAAAGVALKSLGQEAINQFQERNSQESSSSDDSSPPSPPPEEDSGKWRRI